MTKWDSAVVDVTVCPECGADLTPYRAEVSDLNWRDEQEKEAGTRAHALLAHKHDKHRVVPSVGDLVKYTAPWRGLAITSEVYRVGSIWEDYDEAEFARQMGADVPPRYRTRYGLAGLTRRDQGCTPSTGDPGRPIVFTIVQDAPPVEADLFDLLDDWDDEGEDYL